VDAIKRFFSDLLGRILELQSTFGNKLTASSTVIFTNGKIPPNGVVAGFAV